MRLDHRAWEKEECAKCEKRWKPGDPDPIGKCAGAIADHFRCAREKMAPYMKKAIARAEERAPKEHEVKITPEYFRAVKRGVKNFEIRKNDRDYKQCDILYLKEWDGQKFTGRQVRKKITYVLDNPEYLQPGYVALAMVDF